MGGKSAGPPSGYVAPGQTTHVEHSDMPFGYGHDTTVAGAPQEGVYQQAAEAQAWGNRPTQTTPFGSQTWAVDPKTGQWSQSTQLSPELQGYFGSLTGQLGKEGDIRQQASNAIYGQETSRLDPQWAQREQEQRSTLANQGIDPSSAAGQKAMDDFGRQRNDAYQQANYASVMGGGQEAQRQQQMLLGGLGSLQGLLGMPGFQAGPNYLGAVMGENQYKLQDAQQQNQFMSDIMGGLMGLGGAGVKAAYGK